MIYGFIPFGFCGKVSTGKFVFSPPPVEIFDFFFFFFSIQHILYFLCT